MAENKTRESSASVESYLATIDDPTRRNDCMELVRLLKKATKHPPKMWGTSIVGFGSYHYVYESGREGDMCVVGFSSRKGDISVYGLNAAANHAALLAKLGKTKSGKGCLYIRKLADIDATVLAKLAQEAAAARAISK